MRSARPALRLSRPKSRTLTQQHGERPRDEDEHQRQDGEGGRDEAARKARGDGLRHRLREIGRSLHVLTRCPITGAWG